MSQPLSSLVRAALAALLLIPASSAHAEEAEPQEASDAGEARFQRPKHGFPILSVTQTFLPGSQIDDTDEILRDVRGDEYILDVSSKFGLPFNEGRTFVIQALQWNWNRLDLRNWPNANGASEAPTNLHAISYTTALIQRLTDNWSINLFGQPAIYSDLEKFTLDSVVINFIVSLGYRWDADLELSLGIAYLSNFGEPLPLPNLGLLWNTGPRTTLFMNLPQTLGYRYIGDRFTLAARAEVAGAFYRVNGRSTFDLPNEEGQFETQLKDFDYIMRYSAVNIGPVVEFRVGGGFWLTGNLDLIVQRRFEVSNVCVEDRVTQYCGLESFDLDFRNITGPLSYSATVGFQYRVGPGG